MFIMSGILLGSAVVVGLYIAFVLDKSELDGFIHLVIACMVALALLLASGVTFGVGKLKAGQNEERAALIAEVEAVHDVVVESAPEDLEEPNLWLVDGKSVTCYVAVHPKPAGPRLYCAETATYGELPLKNER